MAEEKRKPGRPAGSKNTGSGTKTAVGSEPKAKYSSPKTGSRVKDEIWAIIILAIGAFLVIAIQTGAAGRLGEIISDLLKGAFGHLAYVLPYYLILYGILLFAKRASHITGRSVFFLALTFLMLSLINAGRYLDPASISFPMIEIFDKGVVLQNGGWFGMVIGGLLVMGIGKPGLYLFAAAIILISLLLVINTPVSQFFDAMKTKREENRAAKAARLEAEANPKADIPVPPAPPVVPGEPATPIIPKGRETSFPISFTGETEISPKITEGQMKILDYMKDPSLFDGEGTKEGQGLGLEPVYSDPNHGLTPPENSESSSKQTGSSRRKKSIDIPPLEIEEGLAVDPDLYEFPPLSLLNNRDSGADKILSESNLKVKAAKLNETLANFNVDAKVVKVTQGPAVTQYEIQPNIGVKVSRIVSLADDIALNLEAKSIRIEAPIPGKAAVGIEVENDKINMVTIRELISSPNFQNSKSKITFAVGKDIAGNAIVANLKDMPHLLIAGSTGSGKSVCINSIIVSILYKASPDEVKLVLIDPKVVELANYNGIPHLLIPVVTEPSKAAAALNWAVGEMNDRYKKFAEEGVRDLENYNIVVGKKGEDDLTLPQIVIIIDELADLMMAAPSQVEESICRLAQMARAAGMHLIVATQRPSVDIITGVIKANIPSRIAFAVSSQYDSKTILDMGGAEKLVGKGDMLFSPLGMNKPIRVQGTFISDSEVHGVIDFIKKQVPEVEYSGDVLHSIEKVHSGEVSDDSDEFLKEAIETVVKTGQASVSMLQRRFRIGYNRAARIVDMMEERGIIGPADGSRPRQVLMTEDELYELQAAVDEDDL